MKNSRFTDRQIDVALQQAEAGTPSTDAGDLAVKFSVQQLAAALGCLTGQPPGHGPAHRN